MNKTFKKVVSLFVTGAMMVSMACSALAGSGTITVSKPGSYTSGNNTSWLTQYYITSDASYSNLTVNTGNSGESLFVIENGANVTLHNIQMVMDTDADGSNTSDFTGRGTALAVYDSGTNVVLENSTITTVGVATMPIFIDNTATLTVVDSTIEAKGGTLYQSYYNTANQSLMVSPPWVLGIMGTSRAANIMGTNSTLNFLNSTAKAALWAVLSTDSGTDMTLNAVNSTLELTQAVETDKAIQADGGQITTYDNPFTTMYGTGYGTYVIGSVTQNFWGCTFHVGTYFSIFTGGTMNFAASEVKTYTLTGNNSSSYTYENTVAQRSTLVSDCFGFMAHQNSNVLTMEDTDVYTGNAAFLMKTGGSLTSFTATVSESTFTSEGNMLIQVIDNEDDLIGLASQSTMAFAETYKESTGWQTSTSYTAGSVTLKFNFSDMDLSGNIYNASGYQLKGQTLTVNLTDVNYSGAVASTTAIHINEAGEKYLIEELNGYAVTNGSEEASTLAGYQNATIDISNYYYLGHVANMINYTGYNKINMTISGGSWTVTGDSLIYSLSVSNDAEVIIVGDATLTINGTTYSKDNLASYMSWIEAVEEEGGEEDEPETPDTEDLNSKVDVASIEKTVDTAEVTSGTEVTYTLTSSVPSGADSSYVLTFVDDLAEGTLSASNIAATVAGEAVAATATATENGIEIAVAIGEAEVGDAIVVTYTATIEGSVGDTIVNTAYVTDGENTSVSDTAEVAIIGSGVGTGGTGTWAYTLAAFTLMLAAGVVLASKKREF